MESVAARMRLGSTLTLPLQVQSPYSVTGHGRRRYAPSACEIPPTSPMQPGASQSPMYFRPPSNQTNHKERRFVASLCCCEEQGARWYPEKKKRFEKQSNVTCVRSRHEASVPMKTIIKLKALKAKSPNTVTLCSQEMQSMPPGFVQALGPSDYQPLSWYSWRPVSK